MEEICFKQIGIIRSPFSEPKGAPIQPVGARDVAGRVEIYPEYAKGLKDLEGFSHIYLLYYFHLSKKSSLLVTPFMDRTERGVFSTRAPSRPNPIGLSVVRLQAVEGNTLEIRDIDVVDGTPLLDVKPYAPAFDVRDVERIGWLEGREGDVGDTRADARFVKE
jgi:tRNA-Thr(GGU) m(6)t(6)A37 methyltransferase TsaA